MICSTTTLQAFFDSIYRPQRLLAGSPATIEDYRGTISKATQCAGRPVLLADLDDTFVSAFLAWLLQERRSRATANKHLRNLKALARCAAETVPDQCPKPFRIKPLAEYKLQPNAWTPAQYATILAHIAQLEGTVGSCPAAIWWRALVLTVTNTGLRISAVMNLQTANWDCEASIIRAEAPTQKQKADQWFTLLPETQAALAGLDPVGRQLETLFADWPHDRKKRQWQCLNDHLAHLLAVAGLPSTRRDKFHKFRRTMATMVCVNGGSIDQAQALLGHSSPTITRRYLDPTQIRPPSAAELLRRLDFNSN